jgi:hypothetical protein
LACAFATFCARGSFDCRVLFIDLFPKNA